MSARFFATPADFRAWLELNHERADELIVGFHKRACGRPSITWPESVDEALCFGWIDGIRRRIDEHSYSVRFTPRRPRSIWSSVNIAKVAALTESGLMTPAGLRAFEARSAERSGIYGHEQPRSSELGREYAAALARDPAAKAFFDAQPPSYRRVVVNWVMSAKRAETRERRLARLIADSGAGLRVESFAPRRRG